MGEMRRLYCVILIISTVVIAYSQNTDRIFFEHFSIESGLSHIGVNTIMQDSKGFLWIGTYDGLNRFDGVNFRVFRNDIGDSTSLIHNRIFSIIETEDSLIWIGTEKGLCVYNPTYENFFIPDCADFKIQNSRIIKIFEDSKGRIWVLSDKGNIYIIEKNRTSVRNLSFQNDPDNSVLFWDIRETPNGNFFIASSEGLITLNSDLETIRNNLYEVYCRALDLQGDSLLWLGSPEGLILANYKNNKNNSIDINVIEQVIQGESFTCIHVDNHSNIWAGTGFSGLYKISITGNTDFSVSNYKNDPEKLNTLSNDRTGCIFEDRQGIIWIGSSEKGINKYDPSFRGFHRLSRLNSGNYGLKSDIVLSLIEYNDNILIGTRGKGIYLMNKMNLAFENPEYDFSLLNDISVSSFFNDSRGILWIGTWRGLYCLLPNKKEIERIEKIDNVVVYDISEDDWGNIWIGTRQGLKMLSFNPDHSISLYQDQILDIENKASRFIIRKIYNDPLASTLWIGTWHNGLIQLTGFNNENGRINYQQFKKDPKNNYSLKKLLRKKFDKLCKNILSCVHTFKFMLKFKSINSNRGHGYFNVNDMILVNYKAYV